MVDSVVDLGLLQLQGKFTVGCPRKVLRRTSAYEAGCMLDVSECVFQDLNEESGN